MENRSEENRSLILSNFDRLQYLSSFAMLLYYAPDRLLKIITFFDFQNRSRHETFYSIHSLDKILISVFHSLYGTHTTIFTVLYILYIARNRFRNSIGRLSGGAVCCRSRRRRFIKDDHVERMRGRKIKPIR